MQRPTIREKLMQATLRVILEEGLAAATSKVIAREAGVAVGSIYNHFADKGDLVSAVLLEGLPDLKGSLFTLLSRAGRGTVKNNLERLVADAISYFVDALPVTSAIFGNPQLLPVVHARLVEDGRDLAHLHQLLVRYLAEEQRLGRVRGDLDASMAATSMLGACSYYALLEQVDGAAVLPGPPARFAALIVRELMPNLATAGQDSGPAPTSTT